MATLKTTTTSPLSDELVAQVLQILDAGEIEDLETEYDLAGELPSDEAEFAVAGGDRP